mmetsp:Transcript_88228/g.257890  ORF Transcript_88228/g.257890 Transcript_88228/m.257890 type:complete len:226 (+) Transcript_88228:322-999(+)
MAPPAAASGCAELGSLAAALWPASSPLAVSAATSSAAVVLPALVPESETGDAADDSSVAPLVVALVGVASASWSTSTAAAPRTPRRLLGAALLSSSGTSLQASFARGSTRPAATPSTAAAGPPSRAPANASVARRSSEQSVLSLSAYFDTAWERARASRVAAKPLPWNIWKNPMASPQRPCHAFRTFASALVLAAAAGASSAAAASAAGPCQSPKNTSRMSKPKE